MAVSVDGFLSASVPRDVGEGSGRQTFVMNASRMSAYLQEARSLNTETAEIISSLSSRCYLASEALVDGAS